MLQAGKMEEIADELKKYSNNIIARSEMATRWLDLKEKLYVII